MGRAGPVPGKAAPPAVPVPRPARRLATSVTRLPPASFFLTSAVFHYLGPSLAVLLFARLPVLGVAWLRIAAAALVFALWRRPWRLLATATRSQRQVLVALGIVLAAMNSLFYLAIDRLPLATVGAIEFLGTVVLAAAGARTGRNLSALVLAVAGVFTLTTVRLAAQPLGFVFAFGNCAGFMLYVILGHRIANNPVGADRPADQARADQARADQARADQARADQARADRGPPDQALPERARGGIDQLSVAMLIACVAAAPFGAGPAAAAFTHPAWLGWGAGIGVCSSVIPYVTDQLAMARLSRSTFALMLALLPAAATVIGLVVLHQVPTLRDLAGVGLVIVAVALHQDRAG